MRGFCGGCDSSFGSHEQLISRFRNEILLCGVVVHPHVRPCGNGQKISGIEGAAEGFGATSGRRLKIQKYAS